jgi:hypothetical protein
MSDPTALPLPSSEIADDEGVSRQEDAFDQASSSSDSASVELPQPPIHPSASMDKVRDRERNGPPSHRDDIDIPDYKLIKRIGSGAYGEVWLAQSVTGALRAVKIVWREDFELTRTFQREFLGIQQFEPISRGHPCLVHILHVGWNEPRGFYYCVMELADDAEDGAHIEDVATYVPRTLGTDMKRHGRLDPQPPAFADEAVAGLAGHFGHQFADAGEEDDPHLLCQVPGSPGGKKRADACSKGGNGPCR